MSLSHRRGLWLAGAPLSLVSVALMSVAGTVFGAEPRPPSPPRPPLLTLTPSEPDPLEESVTLETLLEHAGTHAPLLALNGANDARIRAARAAAGRVLPANPELWLGVGPRLEGGETGVDFEVVLSQRFEVGGERSARLRVADAMKKAIEAESRHRQWDLHTTIHALFYQALVARERLVLAKRVVTFQEEIATIVGKQRAAGQVSQLAERVALAESANARQALTALTQEELAVRQDLALVTGWSSETPPQPRGDLTPITGLPTLTELIALAAEMRPDLAVIEASTAYARAQIRAADKDKTPEPIVGLSWTRESSPTGGDTSDVIIATIGLPLPFFSNNEPARADARAALELALAERRRVEAQIAAEVTRAYHAAGAATRRLEAFGAEVLPRFEENLMALRRAYELGEIDILGLASGRERFLEAQRDALTAQGEYFRALAELERAVGVDVIDAHTEDK